MVLSDYWGALTSRQRIGLTAGVLLVALATIGTALWLLLHDPYVPLAARLSVEQMKDLTAQLDRTEVAYRIGDSGDAVTVPRSELGKARAAAASGPFDLPPSVGLELFNETDFSTTDFAQKINYQRALQGELTRTIQTIAGVRSARVHVTLADGGLFKRDAARASAAVTVSQRPGKQLTPAQVRGIQRLVAASVPEIRIGDVVVLDDSGTSLSRVASEGGDALSSAQLDAKREAERYLESKLQRLLRDLAPGGTASLSVDAVVDDRQVRVTTDEPIATRASGDATHPAGVLVKERQSQRGGAAGYVQVDGDAGDAGSTEWEHEYVVGRRTEQTSSAPGAIRRISVAVALQGAPAQLSSATVERLVASAVGIDPARGDSVAVLLLPEAPVNVASEAVADVELLAPQGTGPRDAQWQETSTDRWRVRALVVILVIALVTTAFAVMWWPQRTRARQSVAAGDADIEAIAAKVRQWLHEGGEHGRK